ncbi:hypothetical protein CEXT_2351 [Caerostris extrusa]|uniref:Uncharacterized protein n=1 Tax=Caerostris extrusa TaxID=172846 RepID=A0AAV4S0I0_CAEEX|nr:hypothetical protein CEXT_2351 [Caerostris extrusa]
MTQVKEELLMYLELYSRSKASVYTSWKQPPTHPWYLREPPGTSISFKGDSRDQSALARLSTDHIKIL